MNPILPVTKIYGTAAVTRISSNRNPVREPHVYFIDLDHVTSFSIHLASNKILSSAKTNSTSSRC